MTDQTHAETVGAHMVAVTAPAHLGQSAGDALNGLLIGIALAAIAGPLVWLAFGEFRLAAAVAVALFAAGGAASLIGFALPWGLARLDVDPACGSGPLATICQDLLSLVAYLGVVRLIGA